MKKTFLMLFFIASFISLFGQVPVNQSNKVDGLRPIKPSQSAPNLKTPIIDKDKKPKMPVTENCTCNPHGFNPFEYSYAGGENMTVASFHQFEVDCNHSLMLNGGYKCQYNTPCDVQFKAVLKKNDGSDQIIMTYENFSFPWYHAFETAGNYIFEITPICNKNTCEPAKFFFDVKCDKPIECKCRGKEGWNKFTAYIDKIATKTDCGANFQINIKQQFGLESGYKCEGNCNVTLKGTIINTTTGEEQHFDNVNLSGVINFPSVGEYKLIFRPTCKDEECDVCVFYVSVKK